MIITIKKLKYVYKHILKSNENQLKWIKMLKLLYLMLNFIIKL